MSKDIDLKKHIRSIPDFPKPGILFYDISTLLAHAKAWHTTIERLADAIRPYKPDILAGVESRGFLLAAPLAVAVWRWWMGQDADVDWRQVGANAGALLILAVFWTRIKKLNRETVEALKKETAARKTAHAGD